MKKSCTEDIIHYPFWFGGSASCLASCFTHPLDLVKVRLQTQQGSNGARRTMVQMFSYIIRTEGITGPYRGLSASLLRQMLYSTTRFGVYEKLKEVQAKDSSAPSVFKLIGLASASGLAGGVVGNPADVINVRMQHDTSLPPEFRRNYRNAFDGLYQMVKNEGLGSLFIGLGPNCCRAVLVTVSQLASYDFFKSILLSQLHMSDTLSTHFTASSMAGLVATTVCSPVDVLKTRIMSMQSTGQDNFFSVLVRVYRHEGLSWMFRGWLPSFVRLAPQTILTFVFLEQQKRLYRLFR